MTDSTARAPAARKTARTRRSGNEVEWLIDNAQAYGRLLASLRTARSSVHIAQLAFDADCTVFANGAHGANSRETVLANALIGLADQGCDDIKILLNASWMLDTARPLRKFFAKRGVDPLRIQLRGMNRFPNFMHAKLVLIDRREAFLLGSPFVNSYWDDGQHTPYDVRRPLRELGGRPLHDVSLRITGPAVRDLETMFASVWRACGTSGEREPPARPALRSDNSIRVVCDAPDGILAGAPNGATLMLHELLAAIARAQSFIYIEHQYLTSRPIVAALAKALRRTPALEIIIVLNQNADLTAYRAWQNIQLTTHALLSHPRVGVFAPWSADVHPDHASVTRISQLFIHSKVLIVDDRWAAVGTSNLDGVSMGDYGSDFAGALGKRVFRGVRNVEVNIVIEADDAAHPSIVELRERLWSEHLGVSRERIRAWPEREWLGKWRDAGESNVRSLSAAAPRLAGHVLPYSGCAFPRAQLSALGIDTDRSALELCYNPTWLSVYASLHWIQNIF